MTKSLTNRGVAQPTDGVSVYYGRGFDDDTEVAILLELRSPHCEPSHHFFGRDDAWEVVSGLLKTLRRDPDYASSSRATRMLNAR